MDSLYHQLSPEHRDRAIQILLGRKHLFIFAYDRDGTIFYADGKGAEDRSIAPSQMIGASVFHLNHDWPQNLECHRRALRGESFIARGALNGKVFEGQFTPVFDEGGKVKEVWCVSLDASEHDKLARERALLLDIGQALADAPDLEAALDRVARLSVGVFADYCLIRLAENGLLRLVAVAHVDRGKEDMAFELHRKYTGTAETSYPLCRVLETRKVELYPAITDEMLAQNSIDAQELAALRALAPCSSILLPLLHRENALGVLTFTTTRTDSGRHYTEGDVAFAEGIARRTALAIDQSKRGTP